MNFNLFSHFYFSLIIFFSLCRPNLKLISNRFRCQRPYWIVVRHRFANHIAAHRQRYWQTKNPHAQMALIASTNSAINHSNPHRPQKPKRHRRHLASNWWICWAAKRTRSHRLTFTIIPHWAIWMQRSGKFVAAIHRHWHRRIIVYRHHHLHPATQVAPAQSTDDENHSILSRHLFATPTTIIISISISIIINTITTIISTMQEIIIWCRWRCPNWVMRSDRESTLQPLTMCTVCMQAIAT